MEITGGMLGKKVATIYITSLDNWGFDLMKTTGPLGFVHKMTEPGPDGLKPDDVHVKDGWIHLDVLKGPIIIRSEKELFQLWGIAYIEPEDRK